MIIRRTVKFKDSKVKPSASNSYKSHQVIRLQTATWWFLFLPVLTIKRAI